MTSPTPEGALAIERARGDDRAQIRAEGFRAGAEAMRESAADLATTLSGVVYSPMDEMFRSFGNAVRSLPIPEEQNNG